MVTVSHPRSNFARGATSHAPAIDPFWSQPFRVLQPNLRKIDARRLDVKKLVAQLVDYGANVVVMNAGGLVAWYPTKLPYHRTNEHLTFDFVGDFVAEAHAKGLRVLARIDTTKGYADDYAKHPEWFRIDAQDRPVATGELYEACFNGPYWQRYTFEIAEELLHTYPVEGLFYNAYRYRQCYCATCHRVFQKATGYELPRREEWKDPAWRHLVAYRYDVFASYTARLRAFVKRVNPRAILCYDYEVMTDDPRHSRDSGWSRRTTELMDVVMAVAFDRLTRPLPKWIYWPGEIAKMCRTGYKRPVWVHLCYFTIFGNRRAAQPPAQLTRDLIQIAAHGGSPGVMLSGTFEQDDRKALPALRSTLRYLAENSEYYQRLESVAKTALVYSQRTADYYGKQEPVDTYLSHYRGFYEALTHHHIPFDLLESALLSEGIPSRYRTLLLPNVACVTSAEAESIDRFVQRGGRVIASHETALYREDGASRRDFALQCLGRHFLKRRAMQGAYLKLTSRKIVTCFPQTDVIALGGERPYGGFGILAPLHVGVDEPGAEAEFIFTSRSEDADEQLEDLRLTEPVTNNVPEFAYWAGETETPGLTVNRFGKGYAIYLPWGVGRLYHYYGLPEAGLLLAHLTQWGLGQRDAITDAPLSMEVTLYRQRRTNRLILHLINSSGIESKPLLQAAPLGPISVRVLCDGTRARSLSTKKEVPLKRKKEYAQVVVRRVDIFGAMVIE